MTTEPSAAVVLSRKVSLSQAEAAAVVAQSAALLREGGAPLLPDSQLGHRLSMLGLKDATTCGGKSACIGEIGRQLKVDWLVLVNVSRVAGDRSLALELFDVGLLTVVDKESLLLPGGTQLTGELLKGFVARIKARWPVSLKVPVFPQLNQVDAHTAPP